MIEQPDSKPRVLVDREVAQRYEHVIEVGKKIFTGSSLVDPSKPVTGEDLNRIVQFHKEISPVNPQAPWRLARGDRSIEKGQIADPSTFGNWEAPGGALEHIELAAQAARIVVEELKANVKSVDSVSDSWAREAIKIIASLNPARTVAAAALHDEGREVTHLFYTNEVIGRMLLQRIGIREDITSVLPDEQAMQVSLGQSMDEYMCHLEPEAVIVRIADEFGKRRGGTNRLLQPDDFDAKTQEDWTQNFLKRPYSGRVTDEWARQHIALHNANVPRYFAAMDKWIRKVSSLTLKDLTRKINKQLAPNLKLLDETVPLISKDALDGQIVTRKLELRNKEVTLEAMIRIGGPNKKLNEDGFVAFTKGQTLQVILVDGGTQIARVETLDKQGLSGGKFIAAEVEEHGSALDPKVSVVKNLHRLNRLIGEDITKNHPEITYTEDSINVPYGSIAGVKFDAESNTLEVANAGDTYVVTIDASRKPILLTIDDVYKKDQQTFYAAREVARKQGITVRQALEGRLSEVLAEMHKTIKMGNKGEIRRITGAPSFEVTSSVVIKADNIKRILVFSDGAIPAGVDIHKPEGLQKFIEIIDASGLLGLNERIQNSAVEDPNFERHPRFRDVDDFSLVMINLANK